jgi:deazaflavin-dependent oxidoreductase (nitroreductase family)
MTQPGRRRPSPMLKTLFDAPRWFYDHGLGWLMGQRFLALSHVGRKSGIERQSILEVACYDHGTQEAIVASAFGAKADWYRNIQATPSHRIRVGRTEFVPHQRFLDPAEARTVAEEFARKHRLEARLAVRVFVAMGAAEKGEFSDPVDLMASLPMVAFRPARPDDG